MVFQRLKYSHVLLRTFLLHGQDDALMVLTSIDLKKRSSILYELSLIPDIVDKVILGFERGHVRLHVHFNPSARNPKLVKSYLGFIEKNGLVYEYDTLNPKSVKRMWVADFFEAVQDQNFPPYVTLSISHDRVQYHSKSLIKYIDKYTEYTVYGVDQDNATTRTLYIKRK